MQAHLVILQRANVIDLAGVIEAVRLIIGAPLGLQHLHHAVALENPGATLITADKAYFRLAKPAGQIMLLAHWPVDKGRPGK